MAIGAAGYRGELLGRRLRQERERRGVSVRGLARQVGVSASMISQIETGKSSPSVSTLYAITTALGVTVEDLFAERNDPEGLVGVDPLATVPAARGESDEESLNAERGVILDDRGLRAAPRLRLGPLVRPAQRRMLRLDSGVTWELLGDLPHQSVDFLLVTYAPGGTSSSLGGLMRHPGSEYGHLLSGELVLTLGFEELRLAPGDSISFDSSTPHSYRNEGAEPAVGVWFVLERGR